MDYCKFVNVFHGCGEIELPEPQKIAARWFFIKAGCGNTSPAASLPFSKLTAGPFSGGYPTGYGDHLPNSHSRPPHFPDGKKLLGFSHLHHSGVGAIGYYYNYAVVSPCYNNDLTRKELINEKASPGYYSAFLDGIRCELTVTKNLALHRYTFSKEGGQIIIDFSNNGLKIPNLENKTVTQLNVSVRDTGEVLAEAEIEGIRLFFAVKIKNGRFSTDKQNRAVYNLKAGEKTAELSLALTVKGFDKALSDLSEEKSFDTARKEAYDEWNLYLSKIRIETESEEIRGIFYSNFYHSLIKPSNWYGESFIYDDDGAFMLDFNTLWDMYKTALPLIFLLYKKEGEQISETLLKVCEKLKFLPNSFGLNANYDESKFQARMLGAYVLLSAYRTGLNVDANRMLKAIETDILSEDKRDFTEYGICKSHTFVLDMADACAYAAQAAKETGDTKLQKLFLFHASKWKNAYSKETGLLRDNSSYYEGTLYNYSFRQHADMEGRIALAGGNENFVKLMDKFFGYGKEKVTQPLNPYDYKPIEEALKLGRFQGFNNETDMEAPFSYIFANRHDRTCEVIRTGMKYMFTSGRGGIPGNNDSGALSSYYVLCALGLFPVAGSDTVLLGSPFINSAEVCLSSDKKLKIKVNGNSDKNIYVKSVYINEKQIFDFRIKMSELMRGGELIFNMSDKKEN
ncbi:MAG TPA: glycoside hydrolase domain-containing protein [Clostridia bacterium]|nr:glycoside hydrolase domain-containing protein [Clostridia bacterium]